MHLYLVSLLTTVDPSALPASAQYVVGSALLAAITGLVWLVKVQNGQLAKQGEAMLASNEKSTAGLTAATELSRQTLAVLLAISESQRIAAGIAAGSNQGRTAQRGGSRGDP